LLRIASRGDRPDGGQQPQQFFARRRRGQVVDDARFVPGIANRGERVARGAALRIVINRDVHSRAP
jgi:hypothetical protein